MSITVNDYLARRDSEWMGQIYKFLGLTVGVIVHGLDDEERRAAYAADVTYGTNNEFGFDYLRDNMKYDMSQMVQRGHAFAIVDEVDSILVDEARTPLIISGPSEDRSGLYASVDTIIPKLDKEDFELDEKQRTVNLTEAGNEHAEALLREIGVMKEEGSLYEAGNATLVHHVNQALRAHKLFQRDKDYIVRNGEVVIVDEFTGRMMPGRRYSEGLHQALEAKEHVTVQPENVTLASITFQNYFRLYKKLAGMTGTASTEADEFAEIYKLVVVEIPTNLPIVRADEDDEVYRTTDEKTARHRARDRGGQRQAAADAGRHDLDREVRAARRGARAAAATRRSTSLKPRRAEAALRLGALGQAVEDLRRAQRPLPRAGGLHRRRGRRARARSPSPPTWPAAAPTSSSAATSRCASARRSIRTPRPRSARRRRRRSAPRSPTSSRRRSTPAASTSSAPSGTRAAASTTSCAAAPAARAIRAGRSSSCRCRTT